MTETRDRPTEYDAVLGTQAAVGAVVLGGLEGLKRRLSSPVEPGRVAALSEALKY